MRAGVVVAVCLAALPGAGAADVWFGNPHHYHADASSPLGDLVLINTGPEPAEVVVRGHSDGGASGPPSYVDTVTVPAGQALEVPLKTGSSCGFCSVELAPAIQVTAPSAVRMVHFGFLDYEGGTSTGHAEAVQPGWEGTSFVAPLAAHRERARSGTVPLPAGLAVTAADDAATAVTFLREDLTVAGTSSRLVLAARTWEVPAPADAASALVASSAPVWLAAAHPHHDPDPAKAGLSTDDWSYEPVPPEGLGASQVAACRSDLARAEEVLLVGLADGTTVTVSPGLPVTLQRGQARSVPLGADAEFTGSKPFLAYQLAAGSPATDAGGDLSMVLLGPTDGAKYRFAYAHPDFGTRVVVASKEPSVHVGAQTVQFLPGRTLPSGTRCGSVDVPAGLHDVTGGRTDVRVFGTANANAFSTHAYNAPGSWCKPTADQPGKPDPVRLARDGNDTIVSWTAASASPRCPVTRYEVYRSSGDGPYWLVGTTDAGTRRWTDASPDRCLDQAYIVVAVSDWGRASSSVVTVPGEACDDGSTGGTSGGGSPDRSRNEPSPPPRPPQDVGSPRATATPAPPPPPPDCGEPCEPDRCAVLACPGAGTGSAERSAPREAQVEVSARAPDTWGRQAAALGGAVACAGVLALLLGLALRRRARDEGR